MILPTSVSMAAIAYIQVVTLTKSFPSGHKELPGWAPTSKPAISISITMLRHLRLQMPSHWGISYSRSTPNPKFQEPNTKQIPNVKIPMTNEIQMLKLQTISFHLFNFELDLIFELGNLSLIDEFFFNFLCQSRGYALRLAELLQ